MIMVSLTLRNSAQRGKRIVIDNDQYLIGRHDSCDLRLGGENVSRRHCLLISDPNGVSIQDLNSRNGTLVNGQQLGRNAPHPLSHHDKIQIGDWKFRVSMRDAKTRQPVVRPESKQQPEDTRRPSDPSSLSDVGRTSRQPVVEEDYESTIEQSLSDFAEDLTHQLDALAIELGVGSDDQQAERSDTAQAFPPQADGSDPADTVAAQDRSSTIGIEPDETAAGETRDVSSEKGTKKGESAKTTATQESKDGDDEHESNAGPMQIPNHLRPRGPVDSRDAARQALKRFFGNS